MSGTDICIRHKISIKAVVFEASICICSATLSCCNEAKRNDNSFSKGSFCILPNQGCFDPIPVLSGRFGLGHFGPISRVSRVGPIGVGCFSPVSKVGRFGPSFWPLFGGESF